MALKPCKGCGREVDVSAPTCPGCGRPRPAGASKAKVVLLSLGGLLGIVGALSMLGSVPATSAPAAEGSGTSPLAALTEPLGAVINRQVVDDAIKQYEIAKRSGSRLDACVHAQFVSAAMIQAKDEAGFKHWKDVERADCRKAGVPE